MEQLNWGPVYFIPGRKSGRYPFCHSLFIDADQKVLIDPASDRDLLSRLLDDPGVDTVWLSHYHEDHMTHLDLFDDRPIRIAEQDAPAIGDLDIFVDYYGMTGAGERDYWKQVMVEKFNYRSRRPAGFLPDGEVIDLGGVTVEVIHTPGHTAGHTSFYFREPGVLFVGDYDLTDFGPWYGDLHSDLDQTIASIEKLRKIPARVWIASHEQGVFETDPDELWDRFLGVIQERDNRLLELLTEPTTREQIIDARILYKKKKEPQAFYDFCEWANMGKHLDRLIRQGRAVGENGKYRLV